MRSTLPAILPAALLCLFALPSTHAQVSGTVYACVQRSDYSVRIVPDAVSCTKKENLVQWNVQSPAGPQGADGLPGAVGATGPTGPTGPQGPSGVNLPHVITIASTGNPTLDGATLVNTLAAISPPNSYVASGTQPLVVKLDAGTFAVPQSLLLLPYISLVGSGINSTILTTQCMSSCSAPVLSIQENFVIGTPGYGNISVTDLTLIPGPGAGGFTARLSGQLQLDHVKIINGTGSSFTDTGGGVFLITNSIIGIFTVGQNLPYHFISTTNSQIIASEIDSAPAFAPPANIVCIAAYNSANKPLSSGCQ